MGAMAPIQDPGRTPSKTYFLLRAALTRRACTVCEEDCEWTAIGTYSS